MVLQKTHFETEENGNPVAQLVRNGIKHYSLLEYRIFPNALKRNKAVSRPPMAVTASDTRLLSVFSLL